MATVKFNWKQALYRMTSKYGHKLETMAKDINGATITAEVWQHDGEITIFVLNNEMKVCYLVRLTTDRERYQKVYQIFRKDRLTSFQS